MANLQMTSGKYQLFTALMKCDLLHRLLWHWLFFAIFYIPYDEHKGSLEEDLRISCEAVHYGVVTRGLPSKNVFCIAFSL